MNGKSESFASEKGPDIKAIKNLAHNFDPVESSSITSSVS